MGRTRTRGVVSALAAALIVCWIAPEAGAQCTETTVLTAVADSSIRRGQPNTPAGAESVLLVREGGANRALVRFDLASLEGIVVSATLEIAAAGPATSWGPAGRLLGAHRMTQTWSEDGATWNCAVDVVPTNVRPDCAGPDVWDMGSASAPPFDPAATDALLIVNGDPGVLAFDVTADVALQVAGELPHDGWILLKEGGGGGRIDLAARETETPPRLVVVTAEADTDGDGLCDRVDNCPATPNAGQDDFDGDDRGDACECDGVVCVGTSTQCRLAPACDSRTGDCVAVARPDGLECRLGEIPAFCLGGDCVFAPSTCVVGRLLSPSGASGLAPAPPGTPVFVFVATPALSCEPGGDDPASWGTITGAATVLDDGAFCVEYVRRPSATDPLPEVERHLVAGDCALWSGNLECASPPIAIRDRLDDPTRLCDRANCLDAGDVVAGCPD
jgi:Thrombospondin type 3 repeat